MLLNASEVKAMVVASFYSYKGGTGRTTLLANVAALLAREGHDVACVDLDVNAPGLDVVFSLKDEDYPPRSLLDYFSGAKVSIEEMSVLYRHPELRGRLYIFPIPRVPTLGTRRPLAPIIRGMTDHLETFVKRVQERLGVEFILLDARSGFTSESVVHFTLADEIFVVTRYSYQHIIGTAHILEVIKQVQVGRIKRPLEYFVVINDVPYNLPKNIEEELMRFKEEYAAVLIRENRKLRWKDRIVVFDEVFDSEESREQHEELMRGYMEVIRYLKGADGDG